MKCKKHPRYQGKRLPRTQCPMCRRIFRVEEKARLAAKPRFDEEGHPIWGKDLPSRDLIRPNTDLATKVEAIAEDFTADYGEGYGLDPEKRDQIQFETDMGLQQQEVIREAQSLYDVTAPFQEKAPESNLIRNDITAWCKITGRPWGASFVCPWSHAAFRRLPRAWIAYRDHTDCLVQMEAL